MTSKLVMIWFVKRILFFIDFLELVLTQEISMWFHMDFHPNPVWPLNQSTICMKNTRFWSVNIRFLSNSTNFDCFNFLIIFSIKILMGCSIWNQTWVETHGSIFPGGFEQFFKFLKSWNSKKFFLTCIKSLKNY
jgi:hypothetical protein